MAKGKNRAKEEVKSQSKPKKKAGKKINFWKKHKYPALVLFFLPFLMYVQTWNYEFVLDDKIVMTENAFTKKGINGIVFSDVPSFRI